MEKARDTDTGNYSSKVNHLWRRVSNMAGSKLVREGRVSVIAFILGLSVVVIPLIRTWFGHLDWVFDYLTETSGKITICFHITIVNGLLLIIYRGPLYKVSIGVM